MQLQWKDITSQLSSAAKTFKLFEVACPQLYDLQDSMQGNQINDQKVDIKANLKPDYTLNSLLSSSTIKHPSSLTLQEIVSTYDYAFGFEIMYMKQHPIAQTIYLLSYLYDRQVAKQNQYILGLFDSINTFGAYFQHLARQSMTIRDDDNTFSSFGFSRNKKSHDEVAEQLLKLEKQIEGFGKNNKEQQKVAGNLGLRIKARRFLHMLCKEMGSNLNIKNAEKVKKTIESFGKRIDDIIANFEASDLPQGVFNEDIIKTLRANFSPREIKYPDIKETYAELKNMVYQIDMFLPIPQAFSQIQDRIDQLLQLPLNKLSKSFIVSLFFKPKHDYLDSAIPLAQVIGRDLVDWFNLKQNTVKSEKYKEYTNQVAAFMGDVLLKVFLNRSRWQWETSRIYDNFNYLVHYSNEFDKTEQKKQVQLVTYAYNLGINNMLKQLQTGIQIELYYPEEYGYIFYYIQYLISVSNKNSYSFLMKFDKGYMNAFDEKSLTNKIKKKVSSNMRKMFSSIIFSQGLELYYSAMYKLFFLLLNDKTIKEGVKEKERFISRFQIFRKVLFIKPANYEDYKEEVKKLGEDRAGTIKSIEDSLKEAQTLIQKLSILEEGDIFTHTRNQLASLSQLCVRQGLEVMKIRMKKDPVDKVSITKIEPHYVKISI